MLWDFPCKVGMMEQALGKPPNPSIPERTVHIASLKQLTLRKKHEFKPMELEALHHLGCSSSGYIHPFLMIHPFFKIFKIICDYSSIFPERNLKQPLFPHVFPQIFPPSSSSRKSSPSCARDAVQRELLELREAQAKAEAKVKTLEKRLAKYAPRIQSYGRLMP